MLLICITVSAYRNRLAVQSRSAPVEPRRLQAQAWEAHSPRCLFACIRVDRTTPSTSDGLSAHNKCVKRTDNRRHSLGSFNMAMSFKEGSMSSLMVSAGNWPVAGWLVGSTGGVDAEDSETPGWPDMRGRARWPTALQSIAAATPATTVAHRPFVSSPPRANTEPPSSAGRAPTPSPSWSGVSCSTNCGSGSDASSVRVGRCAQASDASLRLPTSFASIFLPLPGSACAFPRCGTGRNTSTTVSKRLCSKSGGHAAVQKSLDAVRAPRTTRNTSHERVRGAPSE